MRIKMTDAGLEELNNSDAVYDPNTSLYRGYSGCTMRITYTASVSDTPVYGDIGNPNAVTLTWSRTNTAYSDHFNGRLPFLRVRIRPLKAVLG